MAHRPVDQLYGASAVPRRDSEIVLPRWQPDSDVTKCPVCSTEFGLWFRKHHCRKCGRVICSACSPHRITIPRQYIVHPPRAYDEEHEELTSFGGGEVVRVCKPCVPDPWTPDSNITTSPSRPSTVGMSDAQRRQSLQYGGHTGITRRGSDDLATRTVDRRFHRPMPPVSNPAEPRRNSLFATRSHDAASHASLYTDESGRRSVRERGGSDARIGVQHQQQAAVPLTQAERYAMEIHRMSSEGQESRFPVRNYRHSHTGGGSSLDIFNAPWLSARSRANTGDATRDAVRATLQPPHDTTATSSAAPHPPARRRQVKEEDECPVCGEEMPPGEAVREAHITSCIASRFSGSSSVPRPGMITADTTATAATSSDTAASASGEPVSTSPLATRPRAMSFKPRGMAIYKATEKDCSTEDGEPQECVICFEEFQPGDELGRMECWCKFHRTCIRQWWETKGTGSCPTHQLHE